MSDNRKVLLIHPGTQYSHDLARQLYKNNLLYKFYTGFAFATGSIYHKLSDMVKPLKKRHLPGVAGNKLIIKPINEFNALYKIRQGGDAEDIFFKRNEIFQQSISTDLLRSADVVIGYDTTCWITAERCKALGKPFILDASIGHPVSKERIYRQIAAAYPEWSNQIKPKKDLYINYEKQEMELATSIVVPSNFVKQTYTENGIDANKIIVNPFGTDIENFKPTVKSISADTPLVFLFFGSLNARKGLPLLLDAWKELALPNAELLLAGYESIPATVTIPDSVKVIGSVAKNKRSELFGNAHVFVFPSYYEGLAQVQIEAAASGLPVIGTANSGATEMVEHGRNGFIIEPGNKQQLIAAMRYFAENRSEIEKMGAAARIIAEQFSWDNYGNRWKDIIEQVTSNANNASKK